MTLTQACAAKVQEIHANCDNALSQFACKDMYALREYPSRRYDNDVIRTNFSRDIDTILHSSLYNRGADKTQVFSFYRNDDITRRSAHMQYVSRIARVIGKALNLNLELIEAIAIGHDIGHTPFGHKGEDFLSTLYHEQAGVYFNHNVHSVRVLQHITGCNLSLQTLDSILCHNGEKPTDHYEPAPLSDFEEFYSRFNKCYKEKDYIKTLRPGTMEGCVVRVSDIIAYIGKDRQDAAKAKLQTLDKLNEQPKPLGQRNSEIITNLTVDIIENSIGKNYISLSSDAFNGIEQVKKANNDYVYQCDELTTPYFKAIEPMMRNIYMQCISDLDNNNYNAPIYKHYLNGSVIGNFYRVSISNRRINFKVHNKDDIVVDYIASMTDDYFIDCHKYMFPDHPLNEEVQYVGYFDPRYL